MKTCSRCKIEKPESAFYPKVKGGTTLRYICKDCHVAETRVSSYKSRHGMTQEDVLQIVEQQGGCFICGKDAPPWHVDHDHSCEKCTGRRGSCDECRRGVLCSRCNTAIGLFDEDRHLLQSAIEYLQKWSKP